MGRMYTVPYTGTLTNAGGNADLFEILPADDKPCRLRGLVLSQISEVGDAAEEALQISLVRLTATVTGGNGTGVTALPTETRGEAAGFAAEANGATVATSSGSTLVVEYFGWNIRSSPLERWWDREFAQKVVQGEGLVVRCDTTPADDITIAITAYIEEE